MLRLVVIHQLVISLVVGPMLCCCAGSRLVCEAKPDARTSAVSPVSSPCCRHTLKSQDSSEHKPVGQPNDPAKCPCKHSPAKTIAGPADSLNLLPSGTAAFDLPALLDFQPSIAGPATRLDRRVIALSASDLLYAHHNLRC